jgi:hypothetical protein
MIVLPQFRFRRLGCSRVSNGLSGRAGVKAAAPFQRVAAASIGKWKKSGEVSQLEDMAKSGSENFSRR